MIFFTCCTTSHLAQAKILGDSILKSYKNTNCTYFIFLADKILEGAPEGYTKAFNIIEVNESNCAGLNQLIKLYTAFELVCYLKSHASLWLLERYPEEKIVYLDTDILVLQPLEAIREILSHKFFIITPHILEPTTLENKVPEEREFFNSGIYNAGFFAFKANQKAFDLLQWWNTRLLQYCKVKVAKGLFVDQIWFNHLPVLFEETVHVLRDKGYNMGYWNLGERQLIKINNVYYIDDKIGLHPLVFYHFSGYDYTKLNSISKYQNKYSFEIMPVLKELFDYYGHLLQENGHKKMLNIPCSYYAGSKNDFFKVIKRLWKTR